MWLCRTLLCLGIIIGLPSVWETLAFSWTLIFRRPSIYFRDHEHPEELAGCDRECSRARQTTALRRGKWGL